MWYWRIWLAAQRPVAKSFPVSVFSETAILWLWPASVQGFFALPSPAVDLDGTTVAHPCLHCGKDAADHRDAWLILAAPHG